MNTINVLVAGSKLSLPPTACCAIESNPRLARAADALGTSLRLFATVRYVALRFGISDVTKLRNVGAAAGPDVGPA